MPFERSRMGVYFFLIWNEREPGARRPGLRGQVEHCQVLLFPKEIELSSYLGKARPCIAGRAIGQLRPSILSGIIHVDAKGTVETARPRPAAPDNKYSTPSVPTRGERRGVSSHTAVRSDQRS